MPIGAEAALARAADIAAHASVTNGQVRRSGAALETKGESFSSILFRRRSHKGVARFRLWRPSARGIV
jgi:hypothetical protein